MPHTAVFFVPEPGNASLTPPEINAALFYQLAQFIVWGEQHGELAAAHPDLAALLQTAAMALSKGGISEHPSGWTPPGRATNSIEDSQTSAYTTVLGEVEQ